MKLTSEFVSRKLTYAFAIGGDTKNLTSVTFGGLKKEATDEQITKVAEALSTLVNGSLHKALITDVDGCHITSNN